jgi:hypothetical protein
VVALTAVAYVLLVIARVSKAFVPFPISASPTVNVVLPVPPYPTGKVSKCNNPSASVAKMAPFALER